jgi:hypothetical protein
MKTFSIQIQQPTNITLSFAATDLEATENDDCIWTAGIEVVNHDEPDKLKAIWKYRIELHGESKSEAEALRDFVLQKILA